MLQKKKRRRSRSFSSPTSPLQHRLVVQRLLDTLTARPSIQGRGLRIVFIAVGTRGFVQPCLALAKALKKRGHFPMIISTKKFKNFIESHGIECGTIYNESVGHPSGWNTFPSASEVFSAAMLQNSKTSKPGEWKANGEIIYKHCKDFKPDLLLTTLFGEFYALDIAEKINVPWWGVRLSPEVPFASSQLRTSPTYENTFAVSSHPWVTPVTVAWQRASLAFVYWKKGIYSELEEFRTKTLGLPAKSLSEKQLESEKIPLLLGYSPTILELPEDIQSWHIGVGFWFLTDDEEEETEKERNNGGGNNNNHEKVISKKNKNEFSHKLNIFMKKGLQKGGIICLDFGSCEDKGLIERCIEAVALCNNDDRKKRIIVRTNIDFKKSSSNGYKKYDSKFVHFVKDISHSKLFPYCSLIMHHGGAGTTAQTLRCGIPSIIIPAFQFTDQPLWADRVEALNVGIYIRRENPSAMTIKQALEQMLNNYDIYRIEALHVKDLLRTESKTSLSATVDLIESPLQMWAPEIYTDSRQCPVKHSIARRMLKSIQSKYDGVRLEHNGLLLPEDPLEKKCCGMCRFIIPAIFELIYLLTKRFMIHMLVLVKRTYADILGFFKVSSTTFPQVEDINNMSNKGWTADLFQKMGIFSQKDLILQPNACVIDIETRPLAVDEGFTSCLYVCTEKNSDASFVLKMSPKWTVAEQVTSTEQLQHLKEMWVGARSRGKHGGMGCLVPYTWKSSICSFTGEFLHAMEYLDGMVAGNQLEDLPLIQAYQAVGEIAKLHGMFWNRKPKDWNSKFDNLATGRRIVAALGRHHFNIQKGATTLFKYDPMMLGALDHFLFQKPTTIVHGDLRSANVMFPKGNMDRNARCSIIDWGGIMQGKGVFDVAYLLGTGMSAKIRQENEIKVLQHYYCELDAAGANLEQYTFDDLVRDYRICLWLAAALYAIPNIYDRGTLTDENEEAADEVRSTLRKNLQPILEEEVRYMKM